MKILIIAAMQEELDAYLQALPELRKSTLGNVQIYTGQHLGNDLMLARSGIGKVNAALNTTRLMMDYQPDLVINSGSAGGLAHTLAIGDVVIANKLTYYDVDVTAFDYAKGQVPQMPAIYEATREYCKVLEGLVFDDFKTHHGLICSGDSFINSVEIAQQIKEDFPKALALDMESTAIAQVCYVLKTPCLIVRAITDHANKHSAKANDANIPWAMTNSAKVLIAFLECL